MVTMERRVADVVRPESEAGAPYRVMIVDSHPIVRLGLRASLAGDAGFKVVAEADNGDEALKLAERYQPHVVLLETRLQGRRSGFEVARALRGIVPEIRILVLSSHASLSYVRDMIDAGVDGYLLKESRPAEIVDSLRTVVTARQVFSGRVREALAPSWNQGSNSGLTRRQLDVLQRVADGHVNQEIATAMGISVKAVQIHLSGIYSRLGARTRTEAVVMAAKQGLVEIAG